MSTTEQVKTRARGVRYALGRAFLKINGWSEDTAAPNVKKAVVVAAPHTSNWDLAYTLAVSWVLGVRIQWIGKHTLFRPPFGWMMRLLGGLPVDRRSRNNAVQAAADVIRAHDQLLLIVPPEGTRGKSERWKTGFYYIAVSANVPIILGFLDYKNRRGGLGHVFEPSGDIVEDFPKIRAFYEGMEGKYPHLQGRIVLKSEDGESSPSSSSPATAS